MVDVVFIYRAGLLTEAPLKKLSFSRCEALLAGDET